jgi:hypothetical protein
MAKQRLSDKPPERRRLNFVQVPDLEVRKAFADLSSAGRDYLDTVIATISQTHGDPYETAFHEGRRDLALALREMMDTAPLPKEEQVNKNVKE